MQSAGVQRELLTSLAGVAPLADVLADLPLPSPIATPVERISLGHCELSSDARKLLSTTDPDLCTKITQALLSIDSSFLELKEPSGARPYCPNSRAPPLIRAIMVSGMPQPVVRLNKLDLGKYASPVRLRPNTASPDSNPPLQSIQVPVHPNTAQQSPQQQKPRKTLKHKEKHKLPPQSLATTPQRRPRKRRASTSAEPEKQQKTSSSFTISIDRTLVDAPPQRAPFSPGVHANVTRSPLRHPIHVSNDGLTVKLSLSKLHRGRRPAKKQHHSRPTKGAKSEIERVGLDEYEGMFVGGKLPDGGYMASVDQVVPSEDSFEKRHKTKRKKHSKIDPAKEAILSHFSVFLETLLDSGEHCSDDDLFSRSVISQLVAEVLKLKQQAILHEVSVNSLVRLIAILDKHVLDAAELRINVIPDEAEADPKAWRVLAKERITRSIDAGLAMLHITTAPRMPKNVHVEESVEQLINMTKFHLENNVYPEFDPVYKAENKERGLLPRQKRRHAGGTTNKVTLAIYHKLTEVVENLALLIETQPLTDTTVLQVSSLGIFPFFVENVSTLQLSALRLVRAIFSRYEKHRDLILEDIFASLARLPTTKRNLRSFKLSNGQSIQMVSALILQLVQCIVMVPRPGDKRSSSPLSGRPTTPENGEKEAELDGDVQVINSYDLALRTGKNFLSHFLKKCCGGKDEDDFRPLFDNFVQDLLTTLNLPEWPASEVLLTLLGMLLVHSFSNRSNEQSLRLISLEHLGVIAARLRKDAADSLARDHNELIDILAQVLQSKLERRTPSPTTLTRMDAFSENSEHLQKALIAYLNRRSEADPSCAYAKDFYLGQWLQDMQVELEKALRNSPVSSNFPTDPLALDNGGAPGISQSASVLQLAEAKKDVLHSLMDPAALRSLRHLEGVLDERSAATVTRFLASSRALSRSFDKYLQQLLRVLNEPAVHVRTRAMKALSTIIAADPSILSRSDMQRAVQNRFMDHSTLVREAAVDLVGRFVLSRPELTSQYYEMLTERILDTGVSVRKRVIKILRDICVLQPDFPQINDVCVRMIRRIGDEEGIKQLVTGVFRELWFTLPPEASEHRKVLLRRVTNITAVVGACKEYEWFEQLLEQLLKSEEVGVVKSILDVSQMMVDCLVENILTLDETSASVQGSYSPRLVACITTLYLFCKIKPALLLRHATTLHPYLGSKCTTQSDMMVLHYVAQILRQVVPLMEHPSEAFLAAVEEDLVKLIMRHGQMIVQSCLSCLSEVVNNVTHNFVLVKDCFQKFFGCLERVRSYHSQSATHPQLPSMRSSLLRSVFTVGLICKHFDVDTITPQSTQSNPISRRVYSHLTYFSRYDDEEVQLKTVMGVGFFCMRYPELMLEEGVRGLYQEWLTADCGSKKKCQVLRNLQSHLKEVESRLKVADAEWKDKGDAENLQEFGDHHSSVSSNIAQAFLSAVLGSLFHSEVQVRLSALQVVVVILRQGLVHPAQCVPYLITMSTDPEQSVKVKADQQLSEYTARYGHFMQTHLLSGVKKSYEFQQLLSSDVVRGCMENGPSPQSLLSHLYSLVRGNKQHRRGFLRTLLRHFEDYEKNPLGLLLYLADNLAYLPYNTLEEPLFLVHHIDMTISITGTNLLQSFREALGTTSSTLPDEEDEDDLQSLSQRSEGCSLTQLSNCCHSCQGCFLLLLLKQHLKKTFGLTDSKCQRYSPNQSNKAYDKAVSRKTEVVFEPKVVIDVARSEVMGKRAIRTREEYLKQYLEFKQLMNRMDPFEGEEDGSDQETAPAPAQPQEKLQTAPVQLQSIETSDRAPTPVAEPLPPPINSGRRRSCSRASSVSSTGSRGKRRRSVSEVESKPKRRKRVILSSSESDEEDPDFRV